MARRPITCLIACAAGFVVFLDATIVNVAFHSIERSFPGAAHAEVALTLTAYAAVLGALLLPAGQLSDHYGHRRTFLAAFTAFVAASALCGVAVSAEMLIAARVLQAAAAACVAPASLALLFPLFRPDERGYVVGLWSSAAGLATVVGPALGGVAVEAFGWRSIFLVNVPIGALAVGIGGRILRETDRSAQRPDLRAAIWVSLAAGAATLAFFRAAAAGWLAPSTWALFGASAASALLCRARGRATARPLVSAELLRDPALRVANLATLLTSTAGFALLFVNMLFLTTVWGYSALDLGLAVSPGPIVTALTAVPAGRLADRFGTCVVAAPGAVLLGCGATWFALRTGTTPDWVATWLPGSLMTGAGIGLCFPTLAASAVLPAPPTLIGTAVALNGAVRQIGAVAGIAIVVSLVRDVAPAAAPAVLRHGWELVAALAFLGATATLGLSDHVRRGWALRATSSRQR